MKEYDTHNVMKEDDKYEIIGLLDEKTVEAKTRIKICG
jgi:hypothetical protein